LPKGGSFFRLKVYKRVGKAVIFKRAIPNNSTDAPNVSTIDVF